MRDRLTHNWANLLLATVLPVMNLLQLGDDELAVHVVHLHLEGVDFHVIFLQFLCLGYFHLHNSPPHIWSWEPSVSVVGALWVNRLFMVGANWSTLSFARHNPRLTASRLVFSKYYFGIKKLKKLNRSGLAKHIAR